MRQRRSKSVSVVSPIQAEDFKLPTPLRGGVAKSLDSDTPRQTTFDRRLDKIGREERQRDRHIDLTYAAFLTCRNLLNVGHRARHDLIKPATASCDCVGKPCPSLDPRRTNFTFSDTARDQDLRMGNAIDLHARSSRNHAGNGRKNGLSAGGGGRFPVSARRHRHQALLARLSPAKIPFRTRRARKVRERFGALSHSEMP